MKNIAVLGLGHMGAPIAGRLAAAGFRVTGWNRTPGARVDGVTVVDAPHLATGDVVITMLTDGPAVAAVVAAARLAPGTTLIDMSTTGPAAVRALAAALPAGVALVDAPVGGSTGAAATGALRIFAGGRDEDLDRVAPVLEALGQVRRCGPLGSGAAVKVVLNTALVTAVAALADTLQVAAATGVARETAIDLLRTSPLGPAVERALGPKAPPADSGPGPTVAAAESGPGPTVAAGERGPGVKTAAHFAVRLALKDLDLALAAAAGRPLPVATAARVTLAGAAPGQDLGTIVQKGS